MSDPSSDVPTSCHYPAWPAPVAIRLTTLADRPCPYLPGRVETVRAFWAEELPAEIYHDFMDAGFRRSGRLVYQPICRGCRECRPIRVNVARFTPSRSQRRCIKRNADMQVSASDPRDTDEKFALYLRYQQHWHGRGEPGDREEFNQFLYASPVDSIEFTYRDAADRLLAVGLCDLSERSLSSVYFYFDPDASSRSLGTFGALHEIAFAREHGVPFYYLGYWVRDCAAMSYKSRYRPAEVLGPDGQWRSVPIDEPPRKND